MDWMWGGAALSWGAIALTLLRFARSRPAAPLALPAIRMSRLLVFALGLVLADATPWVPDSWHVAPLSLLLLSIGAAWVVVRSLPLALSMPLPEEIEAAGDDLRMANLAVAEQCVALDRANAELRLANEARDEQIALLDRRNATLDRLNRELLQARSIQQEFVETMSHELRTPLNRILLPVGRLGTLSNENPDLVSILRDIRAGVGEIEAWVERAVLATDLSARCAKLNVQPIDVCALVEQAVAHFVPVCAERQTSLQLVCATASLLRWADPDQLSRAVFSLVDNALKHGRPVGGTIHVHLQTHDALVQLWVDDDGPGIPESEQKRVTERFFRGSDARRRQVRGTGLGLSLVAEVVALMGGTTKVGPSPLGGARVLLALPLARVAESGPHALSPSLSVQAPQVAGRASSSSKVKDTSGHVNILVAEDDRDLGRLMADLLSDVGHVVVAEDGEEALVLLEERPFDIVVADIRMPRMDGIQLCENIRADARWTALPVVLVTARSAREAVLRAWDAGADEYVVKPFHPQELLARVRALVNGARARAAVADTRARLRASEQLNEELRRLALAVSHDLLGPLRGVSAALSLAQEELHGGRTHEVADLLSVLLERTHDLEGITAGLLGWCRQAWCEYPTEDVLLSTILHRAASVGALGALPMVEVDCPTGAVRLPAAPFELVVRNLVANAVKHHDKGAKGRVWVRCALQSGEDGRVDWVVVHVEDDGPGISAAMQTEVFRMFRRGDTRATGSGIGLALVQSLVDRFNARLELVSTLGDGAHFSLYWPVARQGNLRTVPDIRADHQTVQVVA